MSDSAPSRQSSRTLVAFAFVYFFWGSTYTAIHVAGLELAAPLVAGCRSILSSCIICPICLLRGKSLRVSRAEAWRLTLVGILMMSVNNVLLTWAETMVTSGFASLVIATVPIMIALIEMELPGGEVLNKRGWTGTLLGTVGMVALVWPSLRGGARDGREVCAFGLLLIAAMAFAMGSVLSRRFRFKADWFVATAWQIGCAGVVNLVIAVAGGTLRTAHWTRSGVSAIVYLAVFGSVVGLSAYTYLLAGCCKYLCYEPGWAATNL